MQRSLNQHQLTSDESRAVFASLNKNYPSLKVMSKVDKVNDIRRYPPVPWLATPDRQTLTVLIKSIRQL